MSPTVYNYTECNHEAYCILYDIMFTLVAIGNVVTPNIAQIYIPSI